MKILKKVISILLKNLNFNIFFVIGLLICSHVFNNQAFAGKKISIKNSYHLRSEVGKLARKDLMHNLRLLVYTGKPNRFFGTSGHKKVQTFLEKTLYYYKTNDMTEVEVQPFFVDITEGKRVFQNNFDTKVKPFHKKESTEYQKWQSFNDYMSTLIDSKKTVTAKNFIWKKKGKSSKKTLIITAHYDTVSHNKSTLEIDEEEIMPGADYNASGVAIALELMKLLSKHDLENSVHIAFIDVQSLGFLGAHHYANSLESQKDNILGVINLEMLGHDSKLFDKMKRERNFNIYGRNAKKDPEAMDKTLYQKLTTIPEKIKPNIKFKFVQNNFKKSGHFRFWDKGIPAITLSQNWESDFNSKGYQSPNDFPETINQQTLHYSLQYVASMVLGYAKNISK